MATIEQIAAFGKHIPSCFSLVLLTITAKWARKVVKIVVFLLEVTQAMGQQSYIFGINRE